VYIFDLVDNDNFFKPFCSKNKYIYYDCIVELVKKSKGRPALYDTDARDCLNIYLNNSQLDYVEEADDISQTVITRSGSDIMRYFRECGWLSEKELGRNGEYETHVTPYCRRLIEGKCVCGGYVNSSLSFFKLLYGYQSVEGSH